MKDVNDRNVYTVDGNSREFMDKILYIILTATQLGAERYN